MYYLEEIRIRNSLTETQLPAQRSTSCQA